MEDNIFDFAVQIVRETGNLLLDFYQDSDKKSRLKDDNTLLTAADLAANSHISDALRKNYPNDYILSEEKDTKSPERLSTSNIWVIDPLDGTTNFSLGVHYWGISLARLAHGIPTIAALYFPVINELYSASKGHGVWMNGEPISTQNIHNTKGVSFFTTDSRAFKRYHIHIPYKPRILGSAAYNFCAVARGISIAGFESTPKIWDIAGSWLILEEAGGSLLPLEASPFPLKQQKDYKKVSFPTLAAANQEIVTSIKKLIIPK